MKKALVLSLVLVLCLVVVGVAYAQWTERLSVEGSVYTGNIDTVWTRGPCIDNEGTLDVAFVECSFSEDRKTMYIDITNAYPGYEATCNPRLHNQGSVPVRIDTVVCSDPGITVSGDAFTLNTVIEPGQEKDGLVIVRIGDTVEQSHTYNFGVRVNTVQWNM